LYQDEKPESEESKAMEEEDGTTPDAAPPAEEEAPKTKRRKEEPSWEHLKNLSRVVPAQLSHVSFLAEVSRFVPVRPLVGSPAAPHVPRPTGPVAATLAKGSSAPIRTAAGSSKSSAAETWAAITATSNRSGGGILMMRDTQPREHVESIELEANKDLIPARSVANVGETGGASGGATIITALEETSARPSVSEEDIDDGPA
jgi:26S proteasome regulatory subunit N2